MKTAFVIFAIIFFISGSRGQTIKIPEPVNFLALGDSYTIGQSVPENERWPVQLMNALSGSGFQTGELRIIAQTGWRTDNLKNAINQQLPLNGFNVVSLLIGVNNQYQGGTPQAYAPQFEDLLSQAIALAGYNLSGVFVLSIPDYAFTPFGNGNPAISQQIDAFNQVNRNISSLFGVTYIDITPISRNGLSNPALIAGDGLHPSGLMYSLWVEEIMKKVTRELSIAEEPFAVSGPEWFVQDKSLSIVNLTESAEIQIYQANGRMVSAERLTGRGRISVSLMNLPAGFYFFRLFRDPDFRITGKFYLP